MSCSLEHIKIIQKNTSDFIYQMNNILMKQKVKAGKKSIGVYLLFIF